MLSLHEFYKDPPSKAASSRYWYAQYLLVLAFGKAFITSKNSPGAPPGHQYASRAMALLPDFIGDARRSSHLYTSFKSGCNISSIHRYEASGISTCELLFITITKRDSFAVVRLGKHCEDVSLRESTDMYQKN